MSHERGLEECVCDPARVIGRFRELQRPLDVLRGRDPVAVAPVAPRPPVEDVGTESVQIGRRVVREDESLVEEADRLADARLRVADDADEEYDLRPIDVCETGADRDRRSQIGRASCRERVSDTV